MLDTCFEMRSQKHSFLFKEFQQRKDDLWETRHTGDISVISEEKNGSGDKKSRGLH